MLCPLCLQREAKQRHHLVPRQVGGKGKPNNSLRICKFCHRALHAFCTNQQLKESYNTLNRITADQILMRDIRAYGNLPKRARRNAKHFHNTIKKNGPPGGYHRIIKPTRREIFLLYSSPCPQPQKPIQR